MQGHNTQIDNGFPHNIFKNQIDFCKTTSRDCLDYSQFKTQISISISTAKVEMLFWVIHL